MKRVILLCASLCAMVLLFAASPARAEYVSANGNDANSCSETAPCATFQHVINEGAAQINCLGSGDYGPVVIQTSIIIDCGTGNVGNVSVSGVGTIAITINTSSAATIVLRHLSLNGNNSASAGVNTSSFASGTLVVEDCTIQGFNSTGISGGILFSPSGGRGSLLVSDTRILNNNNGIEVAPFSGQSIATVTLNRVELSGNVKVGLELLGGVVAGTMRDSVAAGNGQDGVFAGATQVFFTVEESSIVANLTAGIQSNSAGTVVNVGASTISANGTGVMPTSGSIISFGNNQFNANGADGNFTSTKGLR